MKRFHRRDFLVPEDRRQAGTYEGREPHAPVSPELQDEWDEFVEARARAVMRIAVEVIAEENAKRDRQLRAQISRVAELTLLRSDIRKLRLARTRLMSAFRGKVDMSSCTANVR